MILDTGATHHVTNKVSALIDYTPLPVPIPLHVATESTGNFLTGIGSLIARSDLRKPVVIRKVYYCARAKGTLISVAALVEEGACFSFKGNGLCLQLDGHTITSKYKQRRWLISIHEPHVAKTTSVTPSPVSACKTYTLDQSREALKWHKRFGHVGLRVVRRLLSKEMTTGLPKQIENTPFNFSDCLLSKSLRHQTLGLSGRERPQPLELIVSDIAGPFEAGPFGFKYMITFRDVATTFTEATVLRSRDQAPTVFKEFVMKMERQTSRKVKTLRTDGAGEFTSADFLAWLRSQGINKDKTLPYEHNQNGIAERSIRTISDMGRTMLIVSKLPRHF